MGLPSRAEKPPVTWNTVVLAMFLMGVPALFFGIFYAWAAINTLLGTREVSRFIRDHQQFVARRSRDPKVHSFRLARDPQHSGTLLIRLDVEDKATFDTIEAGLNDISQLRFPPAWEPTVRSGEEVGDGMGYAAWGFRELGEGFQMMIAAAVSSLALSVLFLVVAWRRPDVPLWGGDRKEVSPRAEFESSFQMKANARRELER
jgi:hypothetical protein